MFTCGQPFTRGLKTIYYIHECAVDRLTLCTYRPLKTYPNMPEPATPRDTLLDHILRFAPKATMFYSGKLCGLSPDVDGNSEGCLHLLNRGELRLNSDDEESLILKGPCVVLIPRPHKHRVEGLGVDGVDLMCATLSDLALPLSMLLPVLTVVDLRITPRLHRPVELMFEEAEGDSYGRNSAIDRLLQYTLILVLRHLIENDMLRGGVIDAMADARLRPVLEAMHTAPERTWTLASMAALSNLSRSAFAQRFAQVVGKPPLAYLTDWRIGLARDLLAEGQSIKVVASKSGYRSAAAFARVFQRATGSSPKIWQRARLRIS